MAGRALVSRGGDQPFDVDAALVEAGVVDRRAKRFRRQRLSLPVHETFFVDDRFLQNFFHRLESGAGGAIARADFLEFLLGLDDALREERRAPDGELHAELVQLDEKSGGKIRGNGPRRNFVALREMRDQLRRVRRRIRFPQFRELRAEIQHDVEAGLLTETHDFQQRDRRDFLPARREREERVAAAEIREPAHVRRIVRGSEKQNVFRLFRFLRRNFCGSHNGNAV